MVLLRQPAVVVGPGAAAAVVAVDAATRELIWFLDLGAE